MRRMTSVLSTVVAAGLAAAAVATAAPAQAATVASGTTTFTVPLSFVAAAARSSIVATPDNPATASYDSTAKTFALAFPVTGGNASFATLTGSLTHSGALKVRDTCTHQVVTLTGLTYTVRTGRISALEPDGATSVTLFDIGGTVQVTLGNSPSYTATSLTVDPAGASYLDTALGTTFFTAGQQVGSFGTTFTYAS